MKFITPGARKRLIGSAIVLVVVVGGFLSWRHFAHGPTAFDAGVWRAGGNAGFSNDAPRLRMADGLLRDGRLEGLDRAGVEALLGPPTRTDKFAGEDLVYWLGPERGYVRIDSEWLLVRFGPDGRVAQARIARD